MADETPPPATGVPAPPADPTNDSTDTSKPDVPAEVKAALRKANKEAETLRLRLKELEDRDKSEIDRAKEALDQTIRERDDAVAAALRFEVATAKRLDPELVQFLPAGSREDMEAAADVLLARTAPAGPRPPAPNPAQGAKGNTAASSPADQFAGFLQQQLQ